MHGASLSVSRHAMLLLLPAAALALAAGPATGPPGGSPQAAAVMGPSGPGAAHPRFLRPASPAPAGRGLFGMPEGSGNPPLPVVAPLATGRYVNFESPPVKAIALSDDGQRLYVANTAADTLDVIRAGVAATPPPRVVAQIPVGIQPVSVAVQPGTNGRIVWVANFISDDISVVDTVAGVVLDVIEVGDEPVNVVFDDAGAFAFVVLQGPSLAGQFSQDLRPYVVAIDAAARQIVAELPLDMLAARAAAYDAENHRLIVAALHGGNNTSLFGKQVFVLLDTSDPNQPFQIGYTLQLLRDFSVTSAAFANSSLAPWPDPSAQPNQPFVPRIVNDAGFGDDWQDVIAPLLLPNGQIDPAVAQQFAVEMAPQFGGNLILNAMEILQEIVADVPDTVDHDLAVIDVSNPAAPIVTRYIGDVGTTMSAMALQPGRDRVLVANLEPRNLVKFEHNLRGHIVDHQIVAVSQLAGSVVVNPFDLHAGIPGFNNGVPGSAAFSLADPKDIVISADGARAYVAAMGPGRIGILDAASGQVLARLDVGRGPRSLALDNANKRLYVFNRTDLSVAFVDVSSDTSPALITTVYLFNPEPPEVKLGRDFLYSTRFSANFASSCAVCHIDAGLDHLAWDLGDPAGPMQPVPDNLEPLGLENHPVKGPMVTLSLRGLKNHNNLHWRGDRPTFQDFNPAFDKLLGGSELSPEQMDAFTAFIETVVYPPNPYLNRDNSPKNPRVWDGAIVYLNNCQVCHQVEHDGALRLDEFPDDAGLDLGGVFAQIQLVTQLRGLHRKFNSDLFGGFGLIHDGREEREHRNHPMETFFDTFFSFLTPQQRTDLIAFLTAFQTNATNVVGWQVRITPPVAPPQRAAIDQMIAQSLQVPSHNDVIAIGQVAGQTRGFWLTPGGGNLFMADDGSLLDLDSLLASLAPGDVLVFEAVPPGSGRRLGIDWDSDCVLNALDPLPRGTSDLNGDTFVDLVDLATLLSNFGSQPVPREQGDIDGDGDADLLDLSLLLQDFGTQCVP